MIRAVIFDLDGTLVDSNELHVRSWQETFRHFGKEFPLEALRKQIGKGADQYLPEFLDEKEIRIRGKEIEEFRSQLFKKKYLPKVKSFPKVLELFERIKRDGKRIVLASSGGGEEIGVYKRITGIENLVDDEISRDDAQKTKPCPDIFEAALQRLDGCSHRDVIVIGDTPYDAEAAAKVKIAMIGVLCGGFAESDLRASNVVAICRDPADLLAQYDNSPIVQRSVTPSSSDTSSA
jgi:HAD superfamily hydrolase (TIGR01549 family)